MVRLHAIIAASAIALSSGAAAFATPPEGGRAAVLRGLDKVTAKTTDFEAEIGETVAFGSLMITVQYCRKRPPEEPPEVYVGLDIDERVTDSDGRAAAPKRLFQGWMFASNPALNPLEHAVYDVWPLDCKS